jgi:farnesyl diphosphate synthase
MHPDGGIRADLTVALARASGWMGMVGGQALDLAADKLGDPATPSRDHIRRLQAMKTGALIRFGCEAGAILGRATPDERQSLARFGDALGFAFQIADDLLDVEGDAGTVGKATGKDAAAGKATLVSLMGVTAAREKLAEVEADAVAALAPFGERGKTLAEAARFVVARRS